MPNNIVSKVIVKGTQKDLARFTQEVITKTKDPDEDLIFDFEKIIPMPTSFEETPNDADSDQAWTIWYGKDSDLALILNYDWVKAVGLTTRKELQKFLNKKDSYWKTLAARIQSNLKKYGAKTAYDWHVYNWGTKWNSYDFHWVKKGGPKEWNPGALEISFRFTTAWSPPEPIFHTLADKFPTLEFWVSSWGGDYGCRGHFYEGDGSFECGDPTDEIYEEVYDQPMPPEMQDPT